MEERKEITKKGFRNLAFAIIIVGLLINAVLGWLFINSGVTENQMRLGMYLSITLLITGFGVGLAYSRMWKIKGYE